MEIRIYKALWGMEGTYREQFVRIKEAGFAGVEAPLPPADREQEFRELLAEFAFDYIAQIFTSGDHIDTFASQASRAAQFRPRLIVSHSARDGMPPDEQLRFFEQALAAERALGVPVAHETHRSRAMFTPWTTASLLDAFDDLKIAADFSHWCCVCESLLEDYGEYVEKAMRRAIHIHARVGHREGPQVSDPSAPEYAGELAVFEGWWKRIFELRAAAGCAFTTVTPEFGPPGYMPTLPHTKQPVAGLWEVNQWMADRIRQRAASWGYR